MKSRGLGDSVAKFTGIKSLAHMATKAAGYKDCGCNKRKTWLNKQFPYNNNQK